MKHITTQAGDLEVRLVGPTDASHLVVLCHGFGAPGTDLVSLAPEMATLEPALAEVAFAFPAAPIDLSPFGLWGGRAWFPIDMQALDLANRAGRTDLLAAAEPPGMAKARKQLRVAIEQLMGRRPWSRVVLGGFSQGAMMALDLALRLEEACAAVVAFSPTLVDRRAWERGAALRQGLPVFVAHGRQDPLLPVGGSEALVALLRRAGVAVDYHPFDGPHTIDYESLRRASRMLASIAARPV